MITPEQLKQIYPNTSDSLIKQFAPILDICMEIYSINTYARMTAFIAQVGHESGGLRYVEEIASGKAYEGRLELGNVNPGDGVRYKGRGLIQLTGRANYKKISDDMGIDFVGTPDLLEKPVYAVCAACWYWKDRKLNDICDLPDNWTKVYLGQVRTKFEWLTIKVNGGLNGLSDRIAYYNRARKVLQPLNAVL